MATQSDERLLALVRDGHERAFEALVNRYRRPLLNYCRRLSLPEARVEDVLQQALLKTWIALRGGAEVRDIKAWLYRVVHNTAVNAVRDAAHDRERLADPTLRVGAGQVDLERGLAVREALAEVAALPQLQREVIVRTAVGGHSHEQVASDLGITDGAVRGLLYRARATLRTATTALTPVSWLAWLTGRAEQSTPASERLGELAAGGGTAGLGGLLLKGGIAAVTAGTLITGAAVVHLQGHPHPRDSPELAAVPPHITAATARGSTGAAPASAARGRAVHLAATRGKRASGGGLVGARVDAALRARGVARAQPGKHLAAPRSTAPAANAPAGSTQSATTPQSTGSTPGAGSAPAEAGVGSSGASSGASPGEPVGSAAGSSSEAAPSGNAGGSPPAPAPPSESSSGSAPSGESSGAQSGTGESESPSGAQSGGVVGTVVHEVGSLLEHLLH